jgi:transcriptional regulator with XRE-family HTH domain
MIYDMSQQPLWRPEDTLATRLYVMRKQMGLSQREAALKTGVPFGTWQGMEEGRGTRHIAVHVQKICAQLGVDREWLMWGGPLDGGDGTSVRSSCFTALTDGMSQGSDAEALVAA